MDYAVKDGVPVPLGAKMPGTYESERVTYGDSNVEAELDAINSNLSTLITTKSFTDETRAMPANGSTSITFNCAKTGYTLLGAVEFGSGNTEVTTSGVNITGTNNLIMRLRNLSSSLQNINAFVTALYIKV